MDVTFTSNGSDTESGFSLDIRSTSCTEAANLEEDEETSDTDRSCEDTTVQEVVVDAGEILEGALVTQTEDDGLHPNLACQDWKIITDANQVSKQIDPHKLCLENQASLAYFTV